MLSHPESAYVLLISGIICQCVLILYIPKAWWFAARCIGFPILKSLRLLFCAFTTESFSDFDGIFLEEFALAVACLMLCSATVMVTIGFGVCQIVLVMFVSWDDDGMQSALKDTRAVIDKGLEDHAQATTKKEEMLPVSSD